MLPYIKKKHLCIQKQPISYRNRRGLCFIIKDASPLFDCIPHFFAFCVDSTVPVLYTERYGTFAADRAARLYPCKEKEEMP